MATVHVDNKVAVRETCFEAACVQIKERDGSISERAEARGNDWRATRRRNTPKAKKTGPASQDGEVL